MGFFVMQNQYSDLPLDVADTSSRRGLADRVLKGEVFVFRGALQATGLFDLWQDAALRGITASVGKDVADRCVTDGFHRIHEWVAPVDLPRMTDAVYAEIESTAPDFLNTFMTAVFPGVRAYYYERAPNVRFHIPYDIAQAHKKAFDEFAKGHGQGKIAAHGPHRDSWLDCPSNGLNLWFAMGRIRPGNGMTIYPENYEGEYKFQRSGDIADGQKLNKTMSFDLFPGDVILFHTDHVHGSELNRTNETRFAISCRLSIDKPVFPQVHHHAYVHSGWQRSAVLRPFAEVPAMFQPSFIKGLAVRARNKLMPTAISEPQVDAPEVIGTKVGDRIEVSLAAVAVGSVHGVSAALCVARLSETEVVALTRRCPHAGGDLANGWIDGDNVVCPWHNLPFDAESGRSPCNTLPRLRRVACWIEGDKIIVDPKTVLNRDDDASVGAQLVAQANSAPMAPMASPAE